MYDTVLQKQKFAVFRLCPTSSCSASKNFGRDNTYGEYFRSQCLSADDIGIQRAEERLIEWRWLCFIFMTMHYSSISVLREQSALSITR